MAESGPGTIFVVDDDAGLVRLMERSLRRSGYATVSAASGAEAIEQLARTTPDLLLLDLKLQDMEGGEVITRLAGSAQKIPFIIITGQGDERVAVEMMKRGALDYLVKDVNFLDMLPTVVGRAFAHLSGERRLAAAEATARESQALTQAVLDSLSEQVAVLNSGGEIIAVNRPWARVAEAKIGPSIIHAGIGANYLNICQAAAARDEPGAELIAASIQAVLNAPETGRSIEYHHQAADAEQWYLMTVTPLTAAGGGAVVAHVDITERKRLEAEVLQIAETERQRVAADLHDGICQELTGIAFTATALQRELEKGKHPLAPSIATMERAITESIRNTRQVARGLNPVVADGQGLMHALEQLAITTAQVRHVECRFECPKPVSIQDPVAANELYRIAQEALTNAVHHGRAKKVVLKLSSDDTGSRLSVEDNGKGIAGDLSRRPGMGLRIMQYRASRIRGQLIIRSRKRGGTEVICQMSNAPQNSRKGKKKS